MSEAAFVTPLRIVQAPMAGVNDSALTIAVSKAGGLGSLPAAMLSPGALVNELEAIRAAGVGAYNLNFFCHELPTPDEQGEATWRRALAPYYDEHGIDPGTITDAPLRMPFSEATLEVIRPYRPPIVSFHFGLPNPAWVDEIKAWGGMIWSSATTVEEADWLAGRGADAVIAQGAGAGGHRGMFLTRDLSTQSDTATLLAAIRNVIDLPVIAAGGIAGPDEVRAVLDAGAWAAQIGTAYLCCSETRTSPLHRSMLKSELARHTDITNLFSGRPARAVTNRLMRELGPVSEFAPEFPLAFSALAPLRAAAEARGAPDFSPHWCGVDVSGCRDVSAEEQTLWLANMEWKQ